MEYVVIDPESQWDKMLHRRCEHLVCIFIVYMPFPELSYVTFVVINL